MSLYNELKRRNVLRVAAAYVVVAWLVIQVVETIFPAFGFGDAAVRIITIAFAIGLIPTLILSWAFEFTSEGIKREHEVDRSQSITLQTGKKLDRMIMVMLALALGYFAFDKFVLDPVRDAEELAEATQEAREEGRSEALVESYGDKSIAVLPFVNMSDDAGNEYFSDGISEELLNLLAKIPELRVISRTSAFFFKGKDIKITDVARELNVVHILEGSVRKAGNQVRITAQLIDAHSDTHLWSETYDRELTTENLFAIQSEISKAIADALQAELSPETLASIEEVPTDNAEAYDLYLQAINERSTWRGSDTFNAMKTFLERAVALDPNFLRAQVLLAETYGRLLWTGADPDRIYGAKTLELVTDIRRRWPDRIEGHLALGHYYYTVERDYTRALAEYRAVEEVFPNDVETLSALGVSHKRLGQFEESLRYARRLVVLDPRNSYVALELLFAFESNGLVEEALAVAEEGVNKFPEDRVWPLYLAEYRLFLLGDVKGYLAIGERLRKEDLWAEAGADLTWLLYGRGEVKKALEHAATRMRSERRSQYAGIDGWNNMDAEIDTALILRLEGRDHEAQAAADHVLGIVKSWIEAERPFPNTNTRSWYTLAAYYAAIAGDLEAVTEYRASALAAPVDGYEIEGETLLTNAQIDALLGDAAAGWARIARRLGIINPLITPEYAVVHPYYQYLFGDVLAYQEFIAQAKIAD